MKSPVIKRSIVIAGHKTSVSLEDPFWKGLKDIAVGRRTTLSDLVASIDSGRRHGNLSSAIRLFVLDYFQAHTDSHSEGGNGDGDHREGTKSHRPMVAMGPLADPGAAARIASGTT